MEQNVMFQKVVRNYLVGFRWEQIKKVYAEREIFEFIFCFVLMPMVYHLYEEWEFMPFYWLVMIPVLFCRFSEPLHPMILPKIMYLCPMSAEERRYFVRRSGQLHLAVPVMMECIGLLILAAFGWMDLISAAGILLGISMLSVWSCGMRGRDGEWCKWYQVKFDMSKTEGIPEVFGTIFGIASVVIFVFIRCWDYPVSAGARLIWLGITAILQIPLAAGQRQVWKRTVEEAAFYEKEGNL